MTYQLLLMLAIQEAQAAGFTGLAEALIVILKKELNRKTYGN